MASAAPAEDDESDENEGPARTLLPHRHGTTTSTSFDAVVTPHAVTAFTRTK